MSKPCKVRFLMMYTEDVYYDADGNEIHRNRFYDDWTHDSEEPVDLTDDEIEDYL